MAVRQELMGDHLWRCWRGTEHLWKLWEGLMRFGAQRVRPLGHTAKEMGLQFT